MDYSHNALADRLAADYVTGTLRGPARRRLEKLLPAHPALRGAVDDWQARLMPLTLTVAPEAPPAAVWAKIESRIHGSAATQPAALPWWSQLAFWRGLTALATVAAIAFSVLLANPGPAQPPLVVVLSAATPPAAGGALPASFVASISGDGRSVVTRPLTQVALQADRALELWAVPGSGAPTSLGLISAQDATVVRRSKLPRGTAALAVSLEPPSGSPTGAPTGPVLYVGKLSS